MISTAITRLPGLRERLSPTYRTYCLLQQFAAYRQEEVPEVELSDNHADGRHDEIAHERRDDLPERGADDHADGEIDHVAPHRERLELLEQAGRHLSYLHL